ncbi:peptidoglycan-recognition protein LE-like isoform X1 [Zerene cesonia]|uniref:peptidoglycan-recognition protein LE-like isoform X1 n=1 Tax=Zerene cesonia TaxID=33412 RepID=UPI0018E54FDF|nr:peptidoglycan-recognition protein LE-like isoform X1 [Zerene cesonia]
MARNNDVSSCDSNGIRVEGDLGDLQVTELSDSEDKDERTFVEPSASRTLDTLSALPASLVQKSTVPVFGSISVVESENVQFGNNTYFNGPVTIKQIVQNKSGVDNSSYTRTEEDEPKDTVYSHGTKLDDIPLKKHEILVWHKLTFSAVCVTIIGGIIAIVLILPSRGDQQQGTTVSYATESFNSAVVGFCNENIQIIVLSVIMLLLTSLLISYSLLTRDIGHVKAKRAGMYEKPLNKKQARLQCTFTADPLLISPDYLRIVSRSDWLAQPVEAVLDKIRQPVPWVIITHTATETCETQSQCVLRVRVIQTFHIESRGWDDIGYNFLVGGDGSVYYGRGWDYIGAHTQGYNKYSIGIAFIGTFNNYQPAKQQIEACQKLIARGVKMGKLAKDYKLLAHRQLMSTLSPGDKLYDIIKTWPHFVNNFTNIKDLLPNY